MAIDRAGKLHLNRHKANGDPLVAVLTETVTDDHLAELRRDGISYLFAGGRELDLSLAIGRLGDEFGVKRLLLEGGGGINGSFLKAGLIDELSVLVAPVADAGEGPTLFTDGVANKLKLTGVDRLEHDFIHLRYQVS
ncbi:dihydrofolate reductase family protein [Devosia aurantiaca]|uniref:dihydrofolate reductase family protein n=1 Tax=Devosia aurantiaca TaxID=2714858 RepID=UPI002E2AB67A|nr:dihydrofolate reductase family protein [Devosia aurantiaca]